MSKVVLTTEIFTPEDLDKYIWLTLLPSSNDKVSKISAVGAGMITPPGVTYEMFRALAEEEINILAISTSEIKISLIINEDYTLKAIKKLHKSFKLD